MPPLTPKRLAGPMIFAMNESEAHELLAATIEELGIEEAPISEVWLIQDGYVVGCRFECGPILAVWLFDENEVKIFDQDGKLLKVSAQMATGKAA